MRALRIRGAMAPVAAFGLCLGLGLAGTPAGAATELPVDGAWSGPGHFENDSCAIPGHPEVAGIGAGFDATGTLTTLGDSQVTGIVCVDQIVLLRAFGPMTVTSARGSITGTMEGRNTSQNPPLVGPYTFDLVWTVTSGSGEFAGATGTLDVHAVVVVSPFTVTGTISGSITVPPHTPASKDDCKDGGWRAFEDENGQPFANQGQCVVWVEHHV